MVRVNVQQAKTHLSRYLEMVQQGQVVVLCNRNVPVALIKALPPIGTKRRLFGMHRDIVQGLDQAFPEATP